MSRRDGVPVSVFTLACALACAAYARLAASFRTKLAAAAAEKKRLQSILRVRDAPKVRGMFEPIAYARSAFSRRNGTPRQGGALVPRARCEIKVDSKLPRHLLQGLDAYSHAWVIYVFHANTNLAGTKTGGAAKGKVAVPRLDGERVGVLATRTPHRPVPVGLSVGTVQRVDADRGVVVVGGIDLVDGTPVLDIKPYVPFADSIPNSTAPDWVGREAARDEPLKIVRVDVAERAEAPLSSSYARSRAAKTLYADVGLFIEFVREVLSFDIRSIRERNASAEKRKFETYRVVLCDVEVEYTISEERMVEIIDAKAVPREVFDDFEKYKVEIEAREAAGKK
jgi:tRNA-Thr(GGU) m(6)t(6)A37 methyltransferase TsaA|tara:strand:+ start:1196 stop:2212 length:1017 start_codon:yes stop_codon:yes gene_type:complete